MKMGMNLLSVVCRPQVHKKVKHFVTMLNWLHDTVLVIKFGEEKISVSQFF
jgi:hypothetical protein